MYSPKNDMPESVPLRVAFLTTMLTPYRITFYEKLSQRKEFSFLLIFGYQGKEIGIPIADVEELKNTNARMVPYKIWNLGPFRLVRHLGALHHIGKHKPEVLIMTGNCGIVSSWVVAAWARLTHKRIVFWSIGWERQQVGSWAHCFKNVFHRVFLTFPHHILTYSNNGKKVLERLNVPSEKISVCYNGIEVDHLLAQEDEIRRQGVTLRQKHQKSKKPLFIYVGGMVLSKKVDLLLRAFHMLSSHEEVDLWLIGDGPDLNAYKKLAEELNLHVTFFGRIIDDVDIYFSAADITVLPGLGGLALNQSMFWETPCICAKADGTEDDLVYDGVTGFRFEWDNVESLYDAMQRSLKKISSPSFGDMQAEGRKLIVERSNVNEMVRVFVETVHSLSKR